MPTSTRRKPTYLLIADSLREKIDNKDLRPGDRFPTERELVEEFGVARMTVRHALDILQLEGLVDRRRGRTGGTFVRAVPPVVRLECMESVQDQLSARGQKIQTQLIGVERQPVPRHVAAHLRLGEEEEVWVVNRMRSYAGKPASLLVHHLPVRLFPQLEEMDLTAPLYGNVAYKKEVINPVLPSAEQQRRLQLAKQQPLLCLRRTICLEEGEVVDYVEELVNTDSLAVEIEMGVRPMCEE